MRKRFFFWTTALSVALALLVSGACSDDSTGDSDSTQPPTDGAVDQPAGTELEFPVVKTVDKERAGQYGVLAASGAELGVAYYRSIPDSVDQPCPPSGTMTGRPVQDLMYAHYDGSAWGTPQLVVQTVGPPFGLSLVFDGSGAANIGFLGGELSIRECSSSDAMIASSSDQGQSWSFQTVRGAGGTGDTVGHWMSLAVDGSGTLQAVYRDVHFGYYEGDGKKRGDWRFGGGGEGITEGRGDGEYAQLLYAPDGTAVSIAYNNGLTQDAPLGIHLATNDGSGWTVTDQLVPAATLERPSLASDGDGLFGLAYYDPTDKSLLYIESETSDLSNWTSPVHVDIGTTAHGTFGALAYDSQGNPAVSYYRCSNAGETQCRATQDALMFAWRRDGKWKTWQVDTGGNQFCGVYSSLAFTPDDLPVISYQCVVLNTALGDYVETLKIAHGSWEEQ